MPTYARSDLAFDRGEGAYLFDTQGRRYLDFAAGVAVNSLGHAHPHLVEVLRDQAGKLWHTSNLYQIPEQERLGERLVAASFADQAFFCNSGAEAIECALKIARRFHYGKGAPERFRVLTFEGAFHGRTLTTIAAGGQPKHLEGFGPTVDGFDQVKFGDLKAASEAIGPETAAIMVEPIQGEGGICTPPPGFLKGLRTLCDDNGLLLIFDEVQTGMGRTGRLFAHEWDGVEPDVMALAKGLGGGFPIGACLATSAAAKFMTPGTHGSTFGGNPLAMAVANAVLDVVLEDGFLDQVRRVAGALNQRLSGLVAAYPGVFSEVRGTGLLIGLHCEVPNTQVIEAARDHGLLLVPAGGNVARVLPPLIASESEVEDAIAILETVCKELGS
ncbi:MAG: aspartate aminotransferase family protein [Alphaproteobacteria bacterium]|jgi:acetylornithine/N-succinyldiaminopimelate aminotransferase|nr:aspartate aminotransferase family protein [Alphaproteobacteria bacterium]MBT5859596.1 aspartate aminotransferase family protein [Alphaproteobacteria bacterium]